MYEAIKLCTKEKYKVFKQRLLKIFLAFCKSPIFFETLFSTTEISFFYERCSLSKIPRNFIEVVRSMTFPLIADIGNFKGMFCFDEIYGKMCILFFLHLMTVCYL